MSEEIMTMLSNLGALDEEKAVSKKVLNNSERLKDILIDDDIKSLEDRGYVIRIDDKLYLTQSGLVRALSNFS
ncbi:MAG: hypothetical protein ACHQ1H_06345 [Nitrososphaerales archaeon]